MKTIQKIASRIDGNHWQHLAALESIPRWQWYAAADRLADDLERLARRLDECTFRVEKASDRGVFSRLHHICRDTAAMLRIPR